MHTSRFRIVAVTAAVMIFVAPAAPASARPEPQPETVPFLNAYGGSLERVGTQFVRGDDLTGAGAAAPARVPELGSWRP
ncbi:hypothetical protein [Microbacterium sp. P02]|uniref:hypothetical protein n=1 Tax=Microbacterium sp. P02 TaxID=3366260 RepID=UPI00366BDAA0